MLRYFVLFFLSTSVFASTTQSRRSNISKEAGAKTKRGDRSKIDFEATDIDGQRKLPMGSVLNNSQADKNYDFIRVRLRWHPEMVQSASSLDSGRTIK